MQVENFIKYDTFRLAIMEVYKAVEGEKPPMPKAEEADDVSPDE